MHPNTIFEAASGSGAAINNIAPAFQIERSATEQDVKRAYRRLSLQLHPDKNPDPKAVPMFLQVNQAYRALTGIKALPLQMHHASKGKALKQALHLPLLPTGLLLN